MAQTVGADYEVMLAYAERIDAMAMEIEAQTAPMLAALQDGTVMSSMSQGLGPIGAPFTASYMAAMTNQCMNNMEVAAGMHAHAEAIRETAEQYQGTDELHAARLEAEQTMNDDLAQGKDLLSGATEAAMPINLKDQLDPLDPGQTQFVGDIASTRHELEKAGIKGADLGIPAKLADGTPHHALRGLQQARRQSTGRVSGRDCRRDSREHPGRSESHGDSRLWRRQALGRSPARRGTAVLPERGYQHGRSAIADRRKRGHQR